MPAAEQEESPMYRRILSPVVFVLCAALVFPAGAVDIVIDCDQRYQQMEGIGAHLYNWSAYTKDYYPTDQFLDDYLGDLGNSMVRFEMHPNLCTAELQLVDMESYGNYTMELSDDGVAWVCTTLANIVTRDPSVKVIGTVWSPPGWMKDNGRTCCGGHLQPAYYEHYARYLYQWYTFMQNEFGVTLYAMSTQNELRFYEPYNSCIYDPVAYRDMMKVVGAYFDSQGCPVKFFGPEDMTHWADKVVEFIDAIMQDPDARDDLDIIATHGYLDGVISGGGTPEENMELYLLTRQHGLPYWMTETSGEDWHWEDGLGFNSNGTPREGALNGLATKMHTSFVYGFCSGWTYWAYGGPGSTGAYGLSPTPGDMKYIAHKHYSKFIRPGAYRVAAAPDGQDGIWASAYHHQDDNTLTSVILNVGDVERTVNLRINDVTVSSGLNVYRTSAQDTFSQLADLAVDAATGTATITLPPRSMVTLTGAAS
ncbi:MAG: hypothetical protein GF331_25110, partial [Chitinivibrionales bacterium]|nr:hypothetical protein [Chitinivibrionales bacterium]